MYFPLLYHPSFLSSLLFLLVLVVVLVILVPTAVCVVSVVLVVAGGLVAVVFDLEVVTGIWSITSTSSSSF